MKNNKGYSLVEIVIVIAIMAVMGAFIFIGVGLLTGQNARECASNISAALGKEKNYSLTRSATIDCYMELILEDDGYYIRYYQPENAVVTGRDPSGAVKQDDWVLAEEEKIGKKSVKIQCMLDDGSSLFDAEDGFSEGDSVRIVFDRISGAFKSIVVSGTDYTDTFNHFEIDSGRTYEIQVYRETGKHVVTRTDI